MKSYKDLEIYQNAFNLAIEAHKTTLKLPKYECYELGSQTRRSAQSIRANIVEGYGRRKYKADFIKFLIFAEGSLLETESHLEMIKQLYQDVDINQLLEKYSQLGKQLNKFIQYVENNFSLQPVP
jgi:four helix bundle protein